MPFHFKALILVMLLTLPTFAIAKRLFTNFMTEEVFVRRRNIWLALTLAAFLIPNFWVFVPVAAAIIAVGTFKDPNPAALYFFLLLALPPIQEDIPTFGLVKQLFTLDHLRLLSLVLLLPTAFKLMGDRSPKGVPGAYEPTTRRLHVADILVLLYVATQMVLQFPYESLTASVRRGLLLGIDVLLPYFVISRAVRTREMIVEALAAFALAAVILVPLAAVEFVKGWVLYAGLEERWGAAHMISYLKRGDFLRAQVTSGHSIVLGYAMAVALGFWFYLQTRVAEKGWRWLTFVTLLSGLVFTLARGPWVGAVVMVLLFLALGPNAASRSLKALGLLLVLTAIASATPWGDRITEHLPFIGTVDEGTIDYRKRLAETSWLLIWQHPLFGSPYFMQYMEELRQGEGIIDIVNVYASVALSFGLVGLSIFVSSFAAIGLSCFRAVRRFTSIDHDFSMLGAGLLACMGGVLVTIATTSNYLSIPYIYWALAGLALVYVRLAQANEPMYALEAGAEPPQDHRLSWASGVSGASLASASGVQPTKWGPAAVNRRGSPWS